MLAAILAVAAQAQLPAPDKAAQETILSRIRETAIAYADRLQDFICIQATTRSGSDNPSHPHWKTLETLTQELTYFNHRESLKLLTVNGGAPGAAAKIKTGYYQPGGEFGSYLLKVFSPAAQAQFEFEGVESSSAAPVCVFRYRVPLATSTWSVTANGDEIRLAHHGRVHADCQTGAVLQLELETEFTDHKPVGIQADLHYSPVAIGTTEFLLPAKVEEIARYHSRLTKVAMEFRDHRKYSADSVVTFK